MEISKHEIMDYIQKEVGFLDIEEDENDNGELYITEAKFKELSDIISTLERRRRSFEERERMLIEKIRLGKGNYVDLSDKILREKNIDIDGDLFFLSPDNLGITGCYFNQIPK